MVQCKQNNVDIQSFLALLLLVTSQTRSASVESREVEALSNLRRRRPPRSKSWEDKVGAKPQPSRSKTKISLHPCTSREQGLGPARFFWGVSHPRGSRASPRMDRAGVFAITSGARPLQYAWRMVLLPRR